MKKTYIIPATIVQHLAPMAIIAFSTDPQGNLNPDPVHDEESETPGLAKGNHYNVWDDDWTRDEEKKRH